MTIQFFSRSELDNAQLKLLRDGRAANARVSVVSINGKEWTIKDFSSRNFLVRVFVAPFLLKRELNILHRLHDVDGVANECFSIDSNAIAIRFLQGKPLSHMKPDEISSDYLEKMEILLKTIHSHGVVHLDTRGTGNWLVSPKGDPLLIDFQASIQTQWMPKSWRRIIELVDMSGVYKKWLKWHPEIMTKERLTDWEEAQKWRQRWKFRGYFGIRKKHRERHSIQ